MRPFGKKINVNFEKKYDNNDNELKQLFIEHKAVHNDEWNYCALLIQLIVGVLVVVIILITSHRCRCAILKLVCRSQPRQKINYYSHLPSISPSYYQPPYAHTTNLISLRLKQLVGFVTIQ